MPDLPEHRERYIRDYVDGQVRDDEDKVELVQQVGTRRILGHMYEMFDVQCQRSRWWAITDPTNLYMQSDFPEVEQAFIFHLGLGLFMAQRSRMDIEEEREEHVAGSWRRYQQAIDAMDSATEAADYQAIGIRCREALLALVHEHADADWIGELPDPPQKANFKAWGNIFAERPPARPIPRFPDRAVLHDCPRTIDLNPSSCARRKGIFPCGDHAGYEPVPICRSLDPSAEPSRSGRADQGNRVQMRGGPRRATRSARRSCRMRCPRRVGVPVWPASGSVNPLLSSTNTLDDPPETRIVERPGRPRVTMRVPSGE